MKKILFLTLLMIILVSVCLTSCFKPTGSGGTTQPDNDPNANKKSYTVTFDSDGGSSVASQSVVIGKYVTEPSTPIKHGYVFLGWYYGSDKWNFSTPVTGNMTLKAKWTPDPASCKHADSANDGICDNCGTALVLIKFNPENGSPVTYQLVVSGGYATEPTAPTKANYIFAGWYKGSTKWNFSTPVTSDLNLTAKWEPDLSNCSHKNANEDDYCDICNERLNFSVTYKYGTETLTFSSKYNSYSILDTGFTLPVAEKSHYTFFGWFEDELLTKQVTSIDVTKGGDITLYAGLAPVEYSITYELNGGTNASGNPTTYTVSDLPLTLLAPEKEGYTFGGWYTDNTFTQSIEETPIIGDLTPHAKWTEIIIEFKVTYLDHNGNVLATDTLLKSNNDQPLRDHTEFSALTVAGYTFLSWVNPENESEKYVCIPAGNDTDMVIKASIKNGATHSILYYVDGSDTTTETFYEAEGYNNFYIPTTKNGYTFDGWYSDTAYTVKVTAIAPNTLEDVKLYGRFTPNVYNVSFTVDGAPFNGGFTQYTVSEAGIPLPEIPAKEGYFILGWYTKTGQLMVDNQIAAGTFGDLELHAEYSKSSYRVTYHLDDGTNAAGNPLSLTVSDLPITLADPTKNGYIFRGWFTDSAYTQIITELTIYHLGNIDLYAKWEALPFTVTYLDHLGNVLTVDTVYVSQNDQALRSYTEFPALTVEGYKFLNWVNPENESESYLCVPAGHTTDMVVKASIKNEITHNVIYYVDGDRFVSEIFLEVEGFNSFYIPTKGGYTFDGWYTDSACTIDATAIAPGTTEDVTLYGKFIPNVYNVSFTIDGAVFNGGFTQYVVSDEDILLPEIPAKEGYIILGWYTADDQLMVENKIAAGYYGDLELHAVYKKSSYKITYYLNGGSNDDRNVTEYRYEEIPKLYSAGSKEGYVFAGWYTDASYSGEPIISIEEVANQDVKLFALWLPYVEEDTSTETPIIPF